MADAASAAAAVALFPQALVPIVVDLDVRGVRYVDSFLWTTGASCMTPEAYAAQTCDDLDLSVEMGHMLADAVRAQVAHALTLIAHAAARGARVSQRNSSQNRLPPFVTSTTSTT